MLHNQCFPWKLGKLRCLTWTTALVVRVHVKRFLLYYIFVTHADESSSKAEV